MKSKGTNLSDALARKLAERERPPGRLLIIGYGNPLRGDDGIGWRISDQLARRAGDWTKVVAAHQLTPELAEPISEADLVIFIDACYDGQPGSWTCESIRPDSKSSDSFTHQATPAKLLSFTKTLFGPGPEALLISVTGGSFDCGDELSPSAAAAVSEIVTCICEWWDANAERTCA